MKNIRLLLFAALTLIVSLSASAQARGNMGDNALKKWVKTGVWNDGFKAKPDLSTNLSEFNPTFTL